MLVSILLEQLLGEEPTSLQELLLMGRLELEHRVVELQQRLRQRGD